MTIGPDPKYLEMVSQVLAHIDMRQIPGLPPEYLATAGGAILRVDLRPVAHRYGAKPKRHFIVKSMRRGTTTSSRGLGRSPDRWKFDVETANERNRETRRTIRLHVAICSAFHGPKPEWADLVAHRDGNPDNNRAFNLRWSSLAANGYDTEWHRAHPGTIRPGDLADPMDPEVQPRLALDTGLDGPDTVAYEPDPELGF